MSENLASKNKQTERGKEQWAIFLDRRKQHLVQASRQLGGHEKITEKILEDLLTIVLDWNLEDINNQIEYSDIVITKQGIKVLVVEAKRLGFFSSQTNIDKALYQAISYAKQMVIRKVAISDGNKLFLTEYCPHRNTKNGWVDISLDSTIYPEKLWYFSEHGIYRSIEKEELEPPTSPQTDLLHHKYQLPHYCFAYIGDENDTKTWKLPYLMSDRSVDHKRLPSAIRCIISNYRGKKVKDIPEWSIPIALKKLAKAAKDAGKMPSQNPRAPNTFIQLDSILTQFGISID